MKLNISDRAACSDWEDGDGNTATTQAYIQAQETALDHSSAHCEDQEDTDAEVPKRSRTRARKVRYL